MELLCIQSQEHPELPLAELKAVMECENIDAIIDVVTEGLVILRDISEEDIDGDIVIYYKNYSSGIYYGGITYMIRIQGGLKAGEIRQSVAAHISPSASRVMFVTCGD